MASTLLSVLVPALFVACIALFVIVYVLRAMLSAVPGPRRFLDERYLRGKKILLSKAEAALREGKAEAADLRAALVVRPLRSSAPLIEQAQQHNLNLLSRLVVAADLRETRIPNIGLLESIVLSQARLLAARRRIIESRQSLKQQTKKEGGHWAVGEFSRKVRELDRKISENRRELEEEFEKALRALEAGGGVVERQLH